MGGAFFSSSSGSFRVVRCIDQRGAKPFALLFVQFLPIGARQIENIDGALTVGCDMRGVNGVALRINRRS